MKPASLLLVVAALLLALGVLTPHWLSFGASEGIDDGYSLHAGLLVMVDCDHGHCHTSALVKQLLHGGSNLGEKLGILMGLFTVLAGLAATVLGLITGISTNKGKRGPATATFIFFGVAALGAIAFGVLMKLGPSMWSWSVAAFFLGIGFGIAGALMAMQVPAIRPVINYAMMPPMGMQPGFMAPPPGSVPATPPCNQCGGQTQFVQQYGKLFCGRCNRYLV